ncbi:putative RNA-binding Zn-ribbon protein involved in translation (DUF1610 family) [Novosphingobium gossypii]
MNHHHMHVSAECSCGHKFDIDDELCAGGVSFFACPSCGTRGSVNEEQVARLTPNTAVSVPAMTIQ